MSIFKNTIYQNSFKKLSSDEKGEIENEILELHPGESIIIDKKEKHRVQNFGDETLEIIEVQTGTYFGEDDIVRFEDKYGRKDFH